MSKYRYLKPGEIIKVGDQQNFRFWCNGKRWVRVTKEVIDEFKRSATCLNRHRPKNDKIDYEIVSANEIKMFRRRLHIRTRKIKKS